jgi:hypothetical protein
METVIKGSLKQCYGKFHERKQGIDDCECDNQTIEYHSNIDMSWLAAETKIICDSIIGRQFFDDGTICLELETDHQGQAEEAKSQNTFGKIYKLFDLLIIGSFGKRNILKHSNDLLNDFNEGRKVIEQLGCNMQAIKDHSNVDKLCSAADIKIRCDSIIDNQRQIVESTQFSDDSSICLKSETDLQAQAEELEMFQF